MPSFNQRLKELRLKSQLSQQSLADQIGISKSSINMYERGEREPGIETLETFADFFNVDMDYLLGKSDVKNPAANLLGYNYLAEAYAAGIDIDEALKKIPPQEPKLTEGEELLLSLFRRLPEQSQALYIEALRAALKTQGLM